MEIILRSHLARYPAMQIQDVYKLMHQAAMGSKHVISDLESARNWLTRELAEMGEGPPEPMIDSISTDSGIVRIHLRPFVVAGHDPGLLLEAFIRTANEYLGDVRLLEGYWQAAVALDKFPAAKMNEFIRTMKAQIYPAVHHSSEYEKLYRPAYRIVVLAFCPSTWL